MRKGSGGVDPLCGPQLVGLVFEEFAGLAVEGLADGLEGGEEMARDE